MPYDPSARRRMRIASGGLVGLGLLSLGLGISVSRAAPERGPVRVPTSVAVPLPPPVRFGGVLALYGHPFSTARLSAQQLGCTVRVDQGSAPSTDPLSAEQAADLDRLVVEGTAIQPLLAVTGATSSGSITCTGADAGSSQPLYLISSDGHRDELPMAAYSFAALTLVLGVAGVSSLRPEE